MKMKMSGLWLRYAFSSKAVDQSVLFRHNSLTVQPEITTFMKEMPIFKLLQTRKQFLAVQDVDACVNISFPSEIRGCCLMVLRRISLGMCWSQLMCVDA